MSSLPSVKRAFLFFVCLETNSKNREKEPSQCSIEDTSLFVSNHINTRPLYPVQCSLYDEHDIRRLGQACKIIEKV